MEVKSRNEPHQRLVKDTGVLSRTKQSFKDDCDINLIVKRHAQRGMWDHLAPHTPTYGDFTGATDLQDAIFKVDEANRDFMTLPAALRSAVNNDPVQLLEALASEEGTEELIQLGLKIEEEQEPEREEPVGETPTPTE